MEIAIFWHDGSAESGHFVDNFFYFSLWNAIPACLQNVQEIYMDDG